MGHRRKRAERCERCRVHVDRCLCEFVVPTATNTKLALVMHHRELSKASATGPLALAALPNSELHVHGLRETPLDLRSLHEEGRRVLILFPREGARALEEVALDEDVRPVTLVVPDGNWRQATRASRRIPGLAEAEAVTLADRSPTRWGLRRETRATGLATFEAIARAIGVLESRKLQQQLEQLFEKMVATTHEMRGTAPLSAPQDEPALQVVYQDEHLVAIDKPSGLLIHRGWGNDERPAVQRLRDQLGQFVYPVHRLDRATSGVLLFALSSEVARDMQRLFDMRAVDKRYLALCRGHDARLTRVGHPLAKERGAEKKQAITEFELLAEYERYGLYLVHPLTGRTHQIRRHLKHASHPIIGDVRYGKGEHNRLFRERFGFHRLGLHSLSLAFEHPRTGESLRIDAPPSGEFRGLLERLEMIEPVRLLAVEPTFARGALHRGEDAR